MIEKPRKVILQMFGGFLLSIALIVFWLSLCLSWFLRDGMGSDSIQSSGSVAFHRFWGDFWIIPIFTIPLGVIGFVILYRALSSPQPGAGANSPSGGE
jgi:hypothetical protein